MVTFTAMGLIEKLSLQQRLTNGNFTALRLRPIMETSLQWDCTISNLVRWKKLPSNNAFRRVLSLQWAYWYQGNFPIYFFVVFCVYMYLCRPSEASTRYCVIPGGYPPQDWQSLPCAGEELDSNPGLLICSQVRYHWATSPPLWATSPPLNHLSSFKPPLIL